GFNNPEDVKAVQQLLQDKGFYKYDVDKRCGMLTIQAIKKFKEAYAIQTPDGLIFELRTEPRPGLGLGGRISPMKLFGLPPKNSPVIDPVN
ncbi:MAG: peptidoglycan-binding protein, partial [Azoarcus sp.]|nr:peptidoglycan-binding protein [Azoarcus sp.]